MNIIKNIFFLPIVLLSILSCGESSTTDNAQTLVSDSSDLMVEANGADMVANINSDSTPAAQKDCEVIDKHFEKNVFVASDVALQMSIVATDATKDENLGDSHRVFRVINTTDCSLVLEETLPVNRSPDFPYYLIPKTYESQNQIIAIQGFNVAYYFDVKNQKLFGPLEPQFFAEHEGVDAQSGMIKGLTVWGHYIFGRSVDFGTFAFDIADPSNPKPVLPVAEFLIPKTTEYNNLFILDVGNGFSQAIIPTTDIDAGGNLFALDKMFLNPLKVNNTIAKNSSNNRFIILNDNTDPRNEKKVAIDMFSKRKVELPENIALQKTNDVLEWLNSGNK